MGREKEKKNTSELTFVDDFSSFLPSACALSTTMGDALEDDFNLDDVPVPPPPPAQASAKRKLSAADAAPPATPAAKGKKVCREVVRVAVGRELCVCWVTRETPRETRLQAACDDGCSFLPSDPHPPTTPHHPTTQLKKSRAAYEAAIAAAAGIADAPAADQASWLWGAYSDRLSLTTVETSGLGADSLLPLPRPVDGSIDGLGARVRAAAPAAWRAALDAQGGGPLRILSLSPSANAALAVAKSLGVGSPLDPALLFARHKKLAEHAAALAQKPPGTAAGTPGRVLALADGGSLDLSHLNLLIIDTARDAKQRTLLSLPETAGDVAGLLKRHVAGRVAAGECFVALFDSAGGGVAAGKAKGAVWRGKKKGGEK